jgi:hypothetical protein
MSAYFSRLKSFPEPLLAFKKQKKLIGAERKPESRSVVCMVAVVKVWAACRPCFVHQSSINDGF